VVVDIDTCCLLVISTWIDQVLDAYMSSLRCTKCTRGDDEEKLMLCDGCNSAWHTFCLVPPLPDVPSGEWYCLSCISGRRRKHNKLKVQAQVLAQLQGAQSDESGATSPPTPAAATNGVAPRTRATASDARLAATSCDARARAAAVAVVAAPRARRTRRHPWFPRAAARVRSRHRATTRRPPSSRLLCGRARKARRLPPGPR